MCDTVIRVETALDAFAAAPYNTLCNLFFFCTPAYAFQSILEDIASREPQLNKLKEKAHHLWEEQASNKSFTHRVSQLSAWYLALSNLAKVRTGSQRVLLKRQKQALTLKRNNIAANSVVCFC